MRRKPAANVSNCLLRQVREILGMTQAGLGSLLGYTAQHIRNVENGERVVGQIMANRLYLLTGAIITDELETPLCTGEDGEWIPFSAERYEQHLRSWEGGGEAFEHLNGLRASVDFALTALRDKAKTADAPRLELLSFGLLKALAAWFHEFGLDRELRREVLQLRLSGVSKNLELACWLGRLTGKRDEVTQWFC